MTTSGGAEQPISEQDAASFADKLERWGATLPASEQALLSMIMARARSTTGDVEGFSGPSFSVTSALTRSWLTPWALNSTLTYQGVLDGDGAFVKDSGPSWVNSPRSASLGGSVESER